jgi:hypothetical protein
MGFIGEDGFGVGLLGRAMAGGLKRIEQLAGGVRRLGDGAGGVERRLVEVAVGADVVFVVAAEVADGLLGNLGLSLFRRSGRPVETWDGEGGDAQSGESDAGAEGVDALGENAVEDLGGDELECGAVLDERNGDVAR